MTKLTVLSVNNAKPGRHADGEGLYLLVRPEGTRSWVLRMQVNGKRRDFGLGSASLVSLSRARRLAAEMRLQRYEGKFAVAEPAAPKIIPRFSDSAKACHVAIRDGWSNQHHRDSWLASLEQHIFPSFGDIPVDQVTSPLWFATLWHQSG